MKENMEKRTYFETQVFPHLEGLYRAACYLLDSETDAQDLAQETFATWYRSWNKSQISRDSRVWLFRIMANILINKYRPSADLSAATNYGDGYDEYFVQSLSEDRQQTDDSGQVSLSMISTDDVKKAIGDLPDDFRLIVVLSLIEGFTYGEIAEIVGIKLETVRSRLHQGRKLMQRELIDHVACEGKYGTCTDRVRSRRTG